MREKTDEQSKCKKDGRPVHLGDSGYEDVEEGCPGGQAEEMGEEGLLGVLPGRVSAPPIPTQLGRKSFPVRSWLGLDPASSLLRS